MEGTFCILCGSSLLSSDLSEDVNFAAIELKLQFIQSLLPIDSPADLGKMILENPEVVICNGESCRRRATDFLEVTQTFVKARDILVSTSTTLLQLLLKISLRRRIISSLSELKNIQAWNGKRVRAMVLNNMPEMEMVVDEEEMSLEKKAKEDVNKRSETFNLIDFGRDACEKSSYKIAEVPSESSGTHHTYKCSLCGREFKTKQALNGHRNSHLGENGSVACGHCTQHFASGELLSNHLKLHKKERNFCSLCRKTLMKKSLVDHLLHHQNQGETEEVQCNVCKRNFQSPLYLAHHVNVHQGRYTCLQTDCKKTFMSKKELDAHRITHSGQIVMLQCDYCRCALISQEDLHTHMEEHQVSFTSTAFVCDICLEPFPLASTLRDHMHDKHEDRSLHKCKVCKKVFAAKSSLIRHEKYHQEQAQYRCSECKKCFRQKCILEAHLRKHQGITNHMCQHCDVGFSEAKKLRQHLWEFHQVKEKSFTCTLCYKNFKDDQILKDHIDSKHEKLKCKVCDRQFKYSTHLKEHLIRRHAPVRPYTCPVSPTRGFVRQNQLHAHMERSHPDLPLPENVENVTFVVEMV